MQRDVRTALYTLAVCCGCDTEAAACSNIFFCEAPKREFLFFVCLYLEKEW
jgi:hypothetical protein